MPDDDHYPEARGTLDLAPAGIAILERIRPAENLPSLPGVALQVLEMTQASDVSLGQIARVIQQDPALAGRILKVVNSSFFGASRKICTIQQATVVLGLRTVKVMVLSFSLADILGERASGGQAAFDYAAYWRRSLTTAVSARLLSAAAASAQPDEAFIAGLFCDIGMLAAIHVAPDLYQPVLEQLARHASPPQEIERAVLGVTHEAMGRELLSHWSLPESLCAAVGCHHTPPSAVLRESTLSSVIRSAALIGDLFCEELEGDALKAATCQIVGSLPIDQSNLDAILKEVHTHVLETAALLALPIGPPRRYQEVQAQAVVQLARLSMAGELERAELIQRERAVRRHAQELSDTNERLAHQVGTDSLTGVCSRVGLEEGLAAACQEAVRRHQPLALLLIDLDHFKQLNDTFGHLMGDEALRQVGECLRRPRPLSHEEMNLPSAGASDPALRSRPSDVNWHGLLPLVGRYGGEEFVLVVSVDSVQTLRQLAESLRSDISRLRIGRDQDRVSLSASIGGVFLAWDDPKLRPDQLIRGADHCLYEAKRAGRNRVAVTEGLPPVPPPLLSVSDGKKGTPQG